MRAVVDTNVLVSGILNPHGPPARILEAILAETVSVLFDERILGEYREVLARPTFGFRAAEVQALLEFLELSGELITASPLPLVLPDKTDLPFLEVAAAGDADALVTGNAKHFKPIRGRHNVNVISPRDFLPHLEERKR